VQDFLDAHPSYTPDGWSSRQLPPLPPPEGFSDSDAAGESAMDDSSSSEEEDDEDDADEEVEESDESSDSEMAVADAPAEEEEESSEDDEHSDSDEPLRTTRRMRFEDFSVEVVDKARLAMEMALELRGGAYCLDAFCRYLDGQDDVVFTQQRHMTVLYNGLIASMEPVEGMLAPVETEEDDDDDDDDDDYADSESALSD
jgi:hypothetical protein